MSNFKTRKLPAAKKIEKTITTETLSDTPVLTSKKSTLRKWVVGILI
jgi:hypothetical protein